MLKRVKIGLGLFVLGIFLLTGVGSALGQTVKLTWWDPYGPPNDANMIIMIKAVEKEYPEFQVTRQMIPGDVFIQKLATSVAAGNPPDVVHTFGMGMTIQLANLGMALCLDEFIAEDPTWDPDDLYPGLLGLFTYKGKIYGLPLGAAVHTLVWNKKIFREVGLDPERGPKTLDDILSYSSKIYEVDSAGKVEKYGFLPHQIPGGFLKWAYFWGASLYDEESQKITAFTPQTLRALQWWVDFYQKFGGVESASGWQKGLRLGPNDPFMNDLLGMEVCHHFNYLFYHMYAPDLEYGYGEVPPGPGPAEYSKTCWAGTNNTMAVKGTKNPQAAYTFLKEICFDKAYKAYQFFEGGAAYPSASKSLNEYLKDERPDWFLEGVWDLEMRLLEKTRSAPSLPVLPAYKNTLTAQAMLAMLGKKSPEEALKYTEEYIQRELEKALEREESN